MVPNGLRSSKAAFPTTAIIAALTFAAQRAAALNTFPGAEGWGAETTGARASSYVYHVTSLADTNTSGTFRYGVTHNLGGANGQTIVFDIGGQITMASKITVNIPNLTIAGQTAPGPGITLVGWDTYVSANNISLRFMHFRPGDTNGPRNLPSSNFQGDSLSVFGSATTPVTNVILDHVSTSWSIDENMSATWCNRVTVQNCIIAEALNDAGHDNGSGGTETHAYGSLIGSGNGLISYAHNLYESNRSRNPRAGSDITLDFVNNVTYNWNGMNGYSGAATEGITKINYIGNYGIAGPSTASHPNDVFVGGSTNTQIYQTGNLLDGNKNGTLEVTSSTSSMFIGSYTAMPSPFAYGPFAPTVDSALGAYNGIVQGVGYSLNRDATDTRIVNNLTAQTGAIIDSQTQVGYTAPSSVSRPAGFDSDNDGMSDTFEQTHSLNRFSASNSSNDSALLNPLGYSMLEQYLNETALAATPVRLWTSTSGEWNSPAKWNTTTPTNYDIASIQGTGPGTNGTVTLTTASPACFQLLIGGNGGAAGEKVILAGGSLLVLDAITVGNLNAATLQLDSGTIQANYVVLGNTFSGSTYTGTLNLNGGTLKTRQVALGGGNPGAWTTGGIFNWTGGTIQALGDFTCNAPVTLAGASTFDTNGFSASFSRALAGPGGLTKQGLGTLTFLGPANYSGSTAINAGLLIISGSSNALAAITGAGTLELASAKALVSDAITLSTLQIDANATLAIRANGNSTSRITTLTLAGTTNAWTAKLDLTNNSLIIPSTTSNKSTLLATLANQITTASNAGLWNGNGITSAANAADTRHDSTLALVDNADFGRTTFAGQNVDANSLIVTRALLGDADLSGTVDLLDFDRWFSHVGGTTPATNLGDLNLDGTVDLLDFDVWFNHVGLSGLSQLPGDGVQGVPEPASIGCVILSAGALIRRRSTRPARSFDR